MILGLLAHLPMKLLLHSRSSRPRAMNLPCSAHVFRLQMHSVTRLRSLACRPARLHNRLQLPGVLKRILDDLATGSKNILVTLRHLFLLLGKVDAAFLCDPTA